MSKRSLLSFEGSIFDTESREIEAAFRYAVIRFNKVDNDMFELDHIGDSVKVSDSFELSTASKYKHTHVTRYLDI